MSAPGQTYVGHWTCEAPITREEWEADHPDLEAIRIPRTVTVRDFVVWVHGREYRWSRVSTTGFNGSDV